MVFPKQPKYHYRNAGSPIKINVFSDFARISFISFSLF
nr:MAG TPA: hypothetical protein [Caudoviricetes sp.]